MVEVIVSRLGRDSSTNSFVVVLQERGGTRLLPIWIGHPEADSILRQMHGGTSERPNAHDVVQNVVSGLGAQLRRVQITRVEKSIYFAELHLQRDGAVVQIDARPSDSIAIALRLSAPIFAADDLLIEPDDDAAGEGVDATEDDDIDSTLHAKGDPSELNADQLKAYLENLRPEDFGKFNP